MSDTHPCRCEVSSSLGIWWLVLHSLSWAPVHFILFFCGCSCLLSCRCSQVPSWLTELTEHALSRRCLPFSWCEVLITPLVLIPSHTLYPNPRPDHWSFRSILLHAHEDPLLSKTPHYQTHSASIFFVRGATSHSLLSPSLDLELITNTFSLTLWPWAVT